MALPQVYGFLLARCSDPGIAEELCADAFVVAAAQIRAGADGVTLAWLFGVARHKLIDFYRRRDRLRQIMTTLPTDAGPSNIADGEVLVEVLRGLPDSQRAALLLRYQDDLPVAEVARLMEISVPATESLLARGRATLRGRLTAGGDDD